MRAFWCLPAAVLLAAPAAGQPQPVPADGKVVVRLDITPARPLKPTSRIRLLPDLREARAGNQVQGFMKCFMEQRHFFGPEEMQRREKLNEAPLADFDLGPNQPLTEYGGSALRNADEAARMLHADWQVLDNMRRDGVYTLLPDVQYMRQIAQALKTRTRGRIKAGEFAKAADSVATTLALGRTFEAHPTLIGHLVGLAICQIGLGGVEELVQQPGCPNLYWALTALPTPLIGFRTAVLGEKVMVDAHFPGLYAGAWTDAEYRKRVAKLDEILGLADGKRPKTGAAEILTKWAADPARVKAARDRLIDSGIAPDVVRAMSAQHAVLADDVRRYEILLDDQFDRFTLPFWQARPILAEVEAEVVKLKEDSIMAPGFLPAVIKVRQAHARAEQVVAALRIVEAIRLYAAEKGGELPPALGVLTVPVPNDPVSGEPFRYVVRDGVGVLSLASSLPGNAQFNKEYEIRLRK